MKKKIVFLLLILLVLTVITGCTTTRSNYATSQYSNQYNQPPVQGVQGNNPPPQPLYAGAGCGI